MKYFGVTFLTFGFAFSLVWPIVFQRLTVPTETAKHDNSCTQDSPQLDDISLLNHAATFGVCVVSGFMFGVAVEKGRVYEPNVIQGQMLMETCVILKMFLSAISSGMFCLSVMSVLPATQDKFTLATHNFSMFLLGKHYVHALLGGAVLGVGITISGSCPSTVFAQVGALTPNAWYTLAGGLFGILLHSCIDTSPTHPQTMRHNGYYVYKTAGGLYHSYAFTLAAALGAVVAGLELATPRAADITGTDKVGGVLAMRAWPPIVSGVIVGCLQVPVVLAVQQTLSCTKSYCVLVAQFTFIKMLRIKLRYFTKYVVGIHNWWQVSYMAAAVGGAYFSALWSGSLGTVRGVGIGSSFVGGACMLFGAQLAGGGTSGHGISGIALLNKMSFVTVTSMFASGLTSAFLFRSLGMI